MLAAPIIHSRTKYIDFRDRLLAVPNDYNEDDINWAQKYILSSTQDIDYQDNHIKSIIFNGQKHLIIGITTKINYLVSTCNTSQDFAIKDEKSRSVYAFIGFSIKHTTLDNLANLPPFEIQNAIYLESYNKIMATRWDETHSSPGATDPTFTEYNSFSFSPLIMDFNEVVKHVFPSGQHKITSPMQNVVYILPATIAFNQALYYLVLNKILKNSNLKISACTDMQSSGYAKKSEFLFTTCRDTTPLETFCYLPKQATEELPTKQDDLKPKQNNAKINDFQKIEKLKTAFDTMGDENSNNTNLFEKASKFVGELPLLSSIVKKVSVPLKNALPKNHASQKSVPAKNNNIQFEENKYTYEFLNKKPAIRPSKPAPEQSNNDIFDLD